MSSRLLQISQTSIDTRNAPTGDKHLMQFFYCRKINHHGSHQQLGSNLFLLDQAEIWAQEHQKWVT